MPLTQRLWSEQRQCFMYYSQRKQRFTRAKKCAVKDIAEFESKYGDRMLFCSTGEMKEAVKRALERLQEAEQNSESFVNTVKTAFKNGRRWPGNPHSSCHTYDHWMLTCLMSSTVTSNYVDQRQMLGCFNEASFPPDCPPLMRYLSGILSDQYKDGTKETMTYFVVFYMLCEHCDFDVNEKNIHKCMNRLKHGAARALLPVTGKRKALCIVNSDAQVDLTHSDTDND